MTHIKVKKPWELPESHATVETSYWSRRRFLKSTAGFCGGALISGFAGKALAGDSESRQAALAAKLSGTGPGPVHPHNFVEFSQWSAEVAELARALDTRAWPIQVGGLVEKPLYCEAEELIASMRLEERVYRFRCVEGWAMVVPWTGFPLRSLLERVQPLSSARFLRFDSFYLPAVAPAQSESDWHGWPYSEALTLPEAAHDLSFVATGAYGRALLPEQGAPLRLVVPWKYATKSLKAVTRIEFTKHQPEAFWQTMHPGQVDFHCNVNPADWVAGWPQHQEMMIGTGEWRATELLNGYGEAVGGLYA